MAFSEATTSRMQAIADSAAESYPFGSPPKGFDWLALLPVILGLVQTLCKPKTEEARQKLIASTVSKIAMNGCDGCIDCLPPKAAKKLRNKMARRMKVKSAGTQDKLFYATVMAANHHRTEAVEGMTSAFDNDESDDDDE